MPRYQDFNPDGQGARPHPARVPHSIFFFPNGTAAVCDRYGKQMSRYQVGWHGTTIEALAADGVDWRAMPDRNGEPLVHPPSWWTPEKEAAHRAGED